MWGKGENRIYMDNIKGNIFDIKRFAVHDGDGIRTTVFFKGCSLKCVWCHNPEGISFNPQIAFYKNKCVNCGRCLGVCESQKNENGIHTLQFDNCVGCGKCESVCLNDALKLYGKEYTVDELLPILLEDIDYYENGGGITLSGGECLCQAEFCKELLIKCKNHGLNTAVDTCGNVPWANIESVIPYTDTFLFDVKAIDDDIHIKCTGVSNKLILSNLKKLDEQGASIEIRIPYVPKFNAGDIKNIAEFVNNIKNVKKVRVLPYHNYAAGKYIALNMFDTLPKNIPTNEEMKLAENQFKRFGTDNDKI